MDRIGPKGRLIGVDLAPEMLECARERIEHSGWRNVELVQIDMTEYDYAEQVDAVVSTGGLGFVADSDQVIERVARALTPGGRLVILDVKRPERWPRWLFKIFLWIGRPFEVTLDYFDRYPWRAVECKFNKVTFEEMYWGLVYLSCGTKR
jgi:demethylmenaquinone methyltransferase/2-methoxy-6-polyprenyl-1,4-benzoquinol methylase